MAVRGCDQARGDEAVSRNHLLEILERNAIPEPMSGCWLWTGSIFWDGYGQFNYREDGKWVKARAHRMSYRIHNGWFDARLSVLHRCDVPCCVNPDHLFLGTQADNMRDKVAKGRVGDVGKPGERHPGAKLNNSDIYRIRDDQRKRSDIAKSYGVNWSTIDAIKSGRRWGHI